MTSTPTLALLAGGGQLPALLANAAQVKGWSSLAVTFNGQPQPENLPHFTESTQFGLGQVGHILAHLKANRVTHVVLAGHLHKPNILSLKPDAMGLRLLARAVIRHDDALLRSVTDFLQEQGFTLISPQELTPELVAPAGQLTKTKPNEQDIEDIALARSTLAVLGDLDIGQAAIVHNGAILGVEAVEGTDELIRRCATLRGEGEATKSTKKGILVKRAKAMQTDIADLPFLGPVTLQLLAQHNYRGLALQAGKTLLLEREEVIKAANAAGLFIQSDA